MSAGRDMPHWIRIKKTPTTLFLATVFCLSNTDKVLLFLLSQAQETLILWVGHEDMSGAEGELKIRCQSTLRFRHFRSQCYTV